MDPRNGKKRRLFAGRLTGKSDSCSTARVNKGVDGRVDGDLGWRWNLAAICIAFGGVALRCMPWRFIFSPGGVLFPGVDPYYHVFRARALVEHFPHLPLIDSFLAFPGGAPVPWPPGFDWLVAAPSILTGNPGIIPAWGALLVPLLGGLAIYLTYRLGRRVFDAPTGILAALLMALMSGAINYSSLGRVDHHALVAPVELGMFLAMLASLRAGKRRDAIAWGITCGALAAFSVGSWVVTPPLYFLPVAIVLVWVLVKKGRNEPGPRAAALAIVFSAAIFSALVVLLTADLGRAPFALFYPSLFSVTLFVLAAAWVALAAYRPGLSFAVPAIAVSAAVVMCLVAPTVMPPLARALAVVTKGNPYYLDVEESMPLLSVAGMFSFDRAISFYSYLVLLWPFFFAAYAFRTFRLRQDTPGRLLIVVLVLLGLVLMMMQQRFGEYGAPALALLLAWSGVEGVRTLIELSAKPGFHMRAMSLGLVLAAVTAIALSPLVKGITRLARNDPVSYQRALYAIGKRLRQTTPDPIGPRAEPSYGLLTSSLDANVLLLAAQRPVLVSSFATPEVVAANRRAFKILLSDNEPAAYTGLRSLKARYVVVSPIFSHIKAMARLAGIDEKFVMQHNEMVGDDLVVSAEMLPRFIDSLHVRLFFGDGIMTRLLGRVSTSLEHFRLHLESEQSVELLNRSLPMIKVFEVVPGARLWGRASAGEIVRLRLSVRTNTGRVFVYYRKTSAEPDGRFEFVVPYATQGSNAPCGPLGVYRVKIGESVYQAQVSEDEVLAGKSVEVSM